jgi:chromate transport protein ChrA
MLKVDQPITRYISVYFFALTALFLAIGISFILICKKDQPEFYEEYKTYLWGAVVCLITPLLLRCVLDWMQSVDWWQKMIYKDVTTYNLCFFICTSWVLILAQMATLIFGLMRMRQSKEIKKARVEIKEIISSS